MWRIGVVFPDVIMPREDYSANVKGVRQSRAVGFKTGVNPLTPNDLSRRRVVSPLKIKIPVKNLGR
jgi:hypothetical protein